jgi:hypothetical protein
VYWASSSSLTRSGAALEGGLAGIVLENILAVMRTEGALRMLDVVLSICVSVRVGLRARVSRFASLSMPASARCLVYSCCDWSIEIFHMNMYEDQQYLQSVSLYSPGYYILSVARPSCGG